MGKTHSKLLAARHGRRTAWARHAMCESALRVRQKLWGDLIIAVRKQRPASLMHNKHRCVSLQSQRRTSDDATPSRSIVPCRQKGNAVREQLVQPNKIKASEGVDVQLYSFLASALDARLVSLTPRPFHPWAIGTHGTGSRVDCGAETPDRLAIEPRFPGRPARSLATVPTEHHVVRNPRGPSPPTQKLAG
jgi:hypothetical protein